MVENQNITPLVQDATTSSKSKGNNIMERRKMVGLGKCSGCGEYKKFACRSEQLCVACYGRWWYYTKKLNDPEWFEERRERNTKQKRTNYLKNKDKRQEAARKYYWKNRDKVLAHSSAFQIKLLASLKLQLFDTVGGARYVKCDYHENRLGLIIDHINGDGVKDRKRFNRNLLKFYKYYISHPNEAKMNLQILCGTCHAIKTSKEISRYNRAIRGKREPKPRII